MITKVISGGQTGIDRLGLEIAKSLNIPTGGTAPPNYWTEDGSDKSLREFGLVCLPHQSDSKKVYPLRTEQNVINSDGTVYFKNSTDSAGFRCTRNYASKHNKPFIVNPSKEEFSKWLEKHHISILNVAGNRGSKVNNDLFSYASEVLLHGLVPTQLTFNFN